MKKENFVSLVLGTIGGILFALGMCMCLIAEWNAFGQGVIVGVIGLVLLFTMLTVRRKMLGNPPVRLKAKSIGAIILAIVGALVLGVGMCMTMVWDGLLVYGIIIGIVGIIMLLSLIPLCKGLR